MNCRVVRVFIREISEIEGFRLGESLFSMDYAFLCPNKPIRLRIDIFIVRIGLLIGIQ